MRCLYLSMNARQSRECLFENVSALFRAHMAEGDYDALIPRGTEEGTYKIRVGLFLDDLVYGCSEPFRILPADDELWRA